MFIFGLFEIRMNFDLIVVWFKFYDYLSRKQYLWESIIERFQLDFFWNRRVGWRKLWSEKRGVTALLSIFWMRIHNKKKLQRLMNQHIWWASVHLSRKLISFDCNFSYNCFYNFIHRTRKTHQIPSIDAFWSVQAN